MIRQIRALTWEYFRECDWMLMALLSMIVFGPLAFGGLIGAYGTESLHSADQPMKFYINFLGIAAIAYVAPHMHAVISTAQRNRSLPIPTRMLAGVMFVIPVVVTMLSNLLTQFSYQVFSNVQWPVLTTTLSIGAFTSLVFAGGWWLRDFRWYKPLVFSAVVASWIYWLLRHLLDARLRGPVRVWDTLSAIDVLVLAATVLGSWMVMLPAYSRFRRGEADAGWLFFEFLSPQSSLLEIRSGSGVKNVNTAPVPDTPGQALAVMNWENFRSWALGGSAMVAGLLVVTGLLVFRDRGNPLAGASVMATMFCAMVGMLAGQNMWIRKSGEVRSFLLTAPVSDREFAKAMTWGWVKSFLAAWGLIMIAAGLLLGIYMLRYGSESFRAHYEQLWAVKQFGHWSVLWFVLITGLTCWVFTGIMGSLSSTGRMWTMIWTWVLVEAAVIVVLFLTGLAGDGSQWAGKLAERVALGMALVLCVATTLFVFVRASRQGLITASQTLWSALVVATLCALLLTFVPAPTIWKIVWCCTTCLVVTPVAAIPCAVQWSRHR